MSALIYPGQLAALFFSLPKRIDFLEIITN